MRDPPELHEPTTRRIRVYFFPSWPTRDGNNEITQQNPTEFRRTVSPERLEWADLDFPKDARIRWDQQPDTLRYLETCEGFYYVATLDRDQQMITRDIPSTQDWPSQVPPATDEWKIAEVRLNLDFLKEFGHGINKLYFLGQDYHITACLPPVRTLPDTMANERQEFSTLQSLAEWKATAPWDGLRKHVFAVDRIRVVYWGLCPCLQVPGSTVCESGKCYMAPFDSNHDFDGQDIAGKKSQVAPGGWDIGLLWPPPPPPGALISSKAMVGVDGVLNLYLLWQDTKGIAYGNYL
jgi:hypothetical protein